MHETVVLHYGADPSIALYRQQLAAIIVKAANPDMIFLLGAAHCRRSGESIFSTTASTAHYMADCFLLVLMPQLANKELHEWQDKIETHCQALMPVTSIVLPTNIFREWLKERHRFALTVMQSAEPIYNAGNMVLETPLTGDAPTIEKEMEKQLADGLKKAKEFLTGSELYGIRRQYTLAAFMLHQSAEQALRTLVKAGTGYHANTHSIERLLRYGCLVAGQLRDLFPQKTASEKRLLGLLQKAYIHTRYREDYTIGQADLLYLTEKVRRILEILSGMEKSRLVRAGASLM